jgi:hypothetical protein
MYKEADAQSKTGMQKAKCTGSWLEIRMLIIYMNTNSTSSYNSSPASCSSNEEQFSHEEVIHISEDAI